MTFLETEDVKRSGSPAGVPTKVLLGRKENLLVVFVRFAVMTEETIQGVQEWIVKWIVTSKECSEEIEGIRGMEVSGPVEIF